MVDVVASSVQDFLKTFWKRSAEAAHVQVVVDVSCDVPEPRAELLYSFRPWLSRKSACQPVPDPGHSSFVQEDLAKVSLPWLKRCVVALEHFEAVVARCLLVLGGDRTRHWIKETFAAVPPLLDPPADELNKCGPAT